MVKEMTERYNIPHLSTKMFVASVAKDNDDPKYSNMVFTGGIKNILVAGTLKESIKNTETRCIKVGISKLSFDKICDIVKLDDDGMIIGIPDDSCDLLNKVKVNVFDFIIYDKDGDYYIIKTPTITNSPLNILDT